MFLIQATNVNDALFSALVQCAKTTAQRRPSRNGPVISFAHPVLTEYSRPRERVLFSPMRDANPVFHLLESLWMLAGRNDVRFVSTFVKRMREFSDDGSTLWGAYGWRWREFFGYDQLEWIAGELKTNPTSRRCVLQMWNAMTTNHDTDVSQNINPDLYWAAKGGKDVPCNTAIYFDLRDGRLNITVTNRSNDIVWGAYGANAVHMSVLQEYMAAWIGVPVGKMWQFSNDLHLYTDVIPEDKILALASDVANHNYYVNGMLSIADEPAPLIAEGETIEDFNEDLVVFFSEYDQSGWGGSVAQQYETQFFNFVVVPMLAAWGAVKAKSFTAAAQHCQLIGSPDWKIAVREWMERRK